MATPRQRTLENATVFGDADSDRGLLVSGTKNEQREKECLTNTVARRKEMMRGKGDLLGTTHQSSNKLARHPCLSYLRIIQKRL